MSRGDFIIIVFIGIALVAVPFIFRAIDKYNSDQYIREFEVNDDETGEGQEDQSEASGSKKKSSKEIPDGAIGVIEIKSLDICYPVFEGAGSTQLNIGIGHMENTAPLCEKGNAVLAGHNGSRRGVFFTNLSDISIGAKVKITNKEKVTHTYEVCETGVYGPYDETVYQKSDEECLTLFTCAYSGTRRFVVRCRLISPTHESSNVPEEDGQG
ncbi:MAG TPA: class D sortase [Lachnospiraceae bacterium]|nr:class D sortase [Lachnospiraceae bacterium]